VLELLELEKVATTSLLESFTMTTDDELFKMTYQEAIDTLPGCDDETIATQARFQLIKRWQQVRKDKLGWIGDYIFGCDDMPYGINAHTHGLAENFDHLDLQVVLDINDRMINNIFTTCADRIKEGETFEPGVPYAGVLRGYMVTFAKAKEDDREVLRVILPDKDGNLDKETNVLQDQYEGTHD
jgi:hypothetical protein